MRLKDRVAIITGGARGIGKKISQTFLKEGASVYIFDVNEEEGARTVCELQPAYDGKVIFFKVDIT
ncbi:MAG: SDR family NAD(P)-dependent oxidoreductase, partial [Actinobacteria bacterium]|nr:SDR family NAD(P)-dependent oxidoreductase [Actinomycetota bacterium]